MTLYQIALESATCIGTTASDWWNASAGASQASGFGFVIVSADEPTARTGRTQEGAGAHVPASSPNDPGIQIRSTW